MTEEFTFRVIFWVHLFFIMIFNRLLPVLRAKKTGVKLSPDHEAIKTEGKFLFIFRVVSGILVAVVIVIYSFFPAYSIRFQFHLPSGVRWAGVGFSFLFLLFWIYSQNILDRNWSGNLKIQKEHKLIASGPYRVMRNPIYTAMIFWSVGLALFTAHMFFAAFAVVVISWIPLRIRKEEKMMIAHFGNEYLEYMKSTGRYFPKF